MSLPDQLDPELLYLFVFGPGRGESIAVRVPPRHWIVVDSCRIGCKAAAKQVLDRRLENDSYRGDFSCVVLTHPHKDHYRLFSQVLSAGDWRLVGCNDLALDDDWHANPITHRANEMEQIVAEIRSAWKLAPETCWWTWRSSERLVGEAKLTALHPDQRWAEEHPKAKENHLSSAMLLEWQSCRLLLGADVENPFWQEICAEFAALANHAAMKVAHHASNNGVYEGLLSDAAPRFWVATPYSSSDLPQFADGHGPDRLLQRQPTFYLTGLPVAHDRQMEAPCMATREQLRLGQRPEPIVLQFSKALAGYAIPPHDQTDLISYVVASFNRDGTLCNTWCGPGSILVQR